MAYFSKSKSGSPLSSLYFLIDVPNFPDSCCMYFSGSSSSSASTSASNGSSSNGLSPPSSSPNPPKPSASSAGASSKASNPSSPESSKAGSLCGASSLILYLVSSLRPKSFSISASSSGVKPVPLTFFTFLPFLT